jgi:recombination protein RecR
MYPSILKKIIADFQKLPGIGEKTAERLALHLISNFEEEELKDFSNHLARLKEEIQFCPICGMITDFDLCEICSNETRDKETIMVVSDFKDVLMMEKMKTYYGTYHVLGGLIDFSRGITDKDLNIDKLVSRIPSTKELIIATNGTVEGEMTAKFLKQYLSEDHLSITRLAYGLPVGSDLKYADEQTLSKAVENRLKF